MIINQYEDNGYLVTEYADGSSMKSIISTEVPPPPPEPEPEGMTMEDKINYIYYKNMGVI